MERRAHAQDLMERAVGLKDARWDTTEISVCWEDQTNANQMKKSWVRSAVERTWVANSSLRFIGWNQCQPSSRGIRILLDDSNPLVHALGKRLDGMKNGMILNFDFAKWSPDCMSDIQFCIEAIAVHEFGHAIGFTHEQNRSDSPPECRSEMQGTTGDTFLTPYDSNSVMNYCNPRWNGDGRLSPMDITGVQQWYGQPRQPGPGAEPPVVQVKMALTLKQHVQGMFYNHQYKSHGLGKEVGFIVPRQNTASGPESLVPTPAGAAKLVVVAKGKTTGKQQNITLNGIHDQIGSHCKAGGVAGVPMNALLSCGARKAQSLLSMYIQWADNDKVPPGVYVGSFRIEAKEENDKPSVDALMFDYEITVEP
ncbi:MAG TPA: M57 family metalloprotease [Kofleriaceae bacterium]|jgi:hypothetical protein|nr:M57 family metalloprotease [Kofleriaceae bacterium]